MYVCVHQVLEVFVSKVMVRFRCVLEVKTLDYSNFGGQESFKSELELEVFWRVCVHTWSKVVGQN